MKGISNEAVVTPTSINRHTATINRRTDDRTRKTQDQRAFELTLKAAIFGISLYFG